nr:hypothetical protein [Tanacetum cinerariifolium]
MEEINNFQQELDENLFQAWERFKELLMKCPQHYLTEMQEVILFYNGLEVPTRRFLIQKAITRRYLSKFMSESAKRHEENSNLIKEIQASTDTAIRNQGVSIKTLVIQTGQMSKTRQRNIKKIAENVLVGIGKFVFLVDFIILDMLEDIKVLLILERPFLSTAHAKTDVFKRKITLRIREEIIIFKSVKPASSLIKRVYMLSLRERMELKLEARLMRETLVIGRSLDPLNGDYIELNNLNEPFELRINQPTIEEGEVIEELRTRDDELDIGINDYPSCCDYDKKIHIDCAHNLKFSCMIGFEFTHVNFFLLLYVNVMSKKFHNSIMKDKMVYKGNNVIGALMNMPIFVSYFSVVTDFTFLEDMDAYRDKGMGNVILANHF